MQAKRDQNYKTTMLGVSSVDLLTPTLIAVNPNNGALLIDADSVNSSVYTPATKVVAPDGYPHKADYYTTGTADETQINLAITAVSDAGGGSVLLVAGTYTISSPILLKSNVLLYGQGVATIIIAANGLNARMMTLATAGNDHITVQNMKLDGNKAGQSPNLDTAIRIDANSTGVNYLLKNLWIVNSANDGIGLTNLVDKVVVENCIIDSPAGYGVVVSNSTVGARILHCFISSAGLSGTRFSGASFNEVIACTIQNSTLRNMHSINSSHNNLILGNILLTPAGATGSGSNLHFGTEGDKSNRNTIIGNFVSGAVNDNGIYVIGDYNTIAENYSTGNFNQGIRVAAGGSYNVIKGNKVYNNSKNGINTEAGYNTIVGNECLGNAFDGIAIEQDANNYNVITGNTIFDNGRYGLDLSSSANNSDNNTIVGNTFNNNSFGNVNIAVSATNNDISHNIGYATNSRNNHAGFYLTGTITSDVEISKASPLLRITSTKDGTWTVGEVAAALEYYSSDNSGNFPAVGGAVRLVAETTTGSDYGLSLSANSNATTDTEHLRVSSNGNIGINIPTTALPTYDLSFGGNTARTMSLERNTTTNGVGLTVQAGGALLAGTDLNGGTLTLSSGISTGTGSAGIVFQTTGGGTTGTTDSSPGTRMILGGNANGRLTIGSSATGALDGLFMTGDTSRNVLVGRISTGNGSSLAIQSGGGASGETDKSGGNLILSSGISTGNARSNVQFWVASNGSTGTTDNTPSVRAVIFASNSTNTMFSLNNTTASVTGSPFQNAFLISGNTVGGFGAYRHTTAATAGSNMSIQAAGAASSSTDKNGGSLLLIPGISTGTGVSAVKIQSAVPALSTGTADNSFVDRVIVPSPKSIANNTTTTIFSMTLASNTVVAGIIRYAVEIFDGTDLQIEEGIVSYHVTNKGGVIANNTVIKTANQQAMTAGTLTVTFTITGASPALIQLNANSSLTPSTGYPRVTMTMENLTQQTVAIS